MSNNAKSWANIESSEDEEEEEDEIVEEQPPKSTATSERVSDARNFYPPYIVEVACRAFMQVDRKTVGFLFEDIGCNISRVELDGREGIAHIEFKDEFSIIKCFSRDGQLYKDSSIKITATKLPSDANNYNNRRSRSDYQRGGGGGERNNYRNTRDSRDNRETRENNRDNRDRDYRDRDRGEYDNGRDARNRLSRQNDRPRQQFKPADGEDLPPERPKIVILPRSLPVDSIGKPVASLLKPEIFGGGKPHDEAEYVSSCTVLYKYYSIMLSCFLS